MNWFRFASLLVAALFIVSCNHTEKNNDKIRTPAALGEVSAEMFDHLEASELPALKAVAEMQDSSRVRELMNGIRVAQILASSFDARLEKMSKEVEVDQLLSSQLYCRLLEMRPNQERIEDKLRVIYATAARQGQTGKDWFHSQLRDFAKVDAMNEVAVMQMVRLLSEDEVAFCGADGCVKDEAMKWPEFRINPFDDEGMAKYTKTNMTLYTKLTKSDMQSGNCFGEKREPNQAGVYDWKNRNWLGTGLPQGHFVFTYDDGPHATHTKTIRDAWSNAGMAKPAFFWLSKNVNSLSSVVKSTLAEGNVIASHSMSHQNLGALAKAGNTKALKSEIDDAVATLSTAVGHKVRYFRLPYGSGVKNSVIGARFQALNLEHFFWRVDSLDWQDKNPASIRDRVVAQMKATGRGIVLFHDIHSQSAKASELVVSYLKANPQYKAVSILDLPGIPK